MVVEATSSRSETRAKIVDAAARLLQEEGPGAVTTRRVAEGAGVQAPTIYRLFGDKDGLLEAVAEHVMASYVSTKAAIVQAASAADVDPLDDLHAGWEAQIDFAVANPALFHLFSDPVRVLDSPAAQSGRHVLESRVHRVALTGRLRVSEQRAVGLIQAAGIGAVHMLLATPADQRDPDLGESLYQAVLGHLLTDVPHQLAGGPIATTVGFRAIAPQLDVLTEAEQQLLREWLDRVIDAAI